MAGADDGGVDADCPPVWPSALRLLGPPPGLSAGHARPMPGDGRGTVVVAVASLARAAVRRPGDIPGLLSDEARALRRLLGRRGA